MLNTNLPHQSLSAFTDVYDVPFVGQLWRSLHNIVSYRKVCVPYQDEGSVSSVGLIILFKSSTEVNINMEGQ